MAQSDWLYYGGAWYYLGESGAMATGWALDGDTWYYLNRSGVMQTGWINLGSWYYLNGSGAMLTGWQWIGGAWYYLWDSGAMATGWVLLDDTWYYLNGSGAMLTGWQWIGGAWYYLNGSGAMLTGWQNISGAQYYLYPSGAMASGWMLDGEDWYYFNSSGAKTSGWQSVGGSWYYLDPANNGIMVSDTMKAIGGATYSFTASGSMRANCLIELDDGACGHANSSGAVAVIGVFSGSDVILKSSSGALLTGWQLLNGTWFHASSEGVAQKGWLQLGSTWYYLDQNTGAMATGWRTIDGKRYFFNSSGAWVDGGPMGAKAQGYSSRTGYLILVDKSTHTVGVFSGSRNNWSLYLTWQCVTGAPSTPTPSGTFVTSGFKRPHLTTNSNAITCTQISGGYFFHSILSSTSELGKSLSHGCVRLPYDGARWIYNNIGAGTTVVIY